MKKTIESAVRWALLWHEENKLDGLREWIVFENYMPALFHTRREARNWAQDRYGYIKTRKDLRIEPHGWRFPRPIKVKLVVLG